MTIDPSSVPTVILNNGLQMPQIGYGVFQVPLDETQRAVEQALGVGYRHIDTAAAYKNESGVGRAIAASGVPREELWITTKLRNADHGKGNVRVAYAASLTALGLDQLDLYLLHWPVPAKGLYVETYAEMENLAKEGLVRAVGVCNFLPSHLDELVSSADIVPAVNQFEVHPTYQQRDAQEATRGHGIAVEAYGPLGMAQDLSNETVVARAEARGVTAAQVILRWHLQQGRIVIPKSVNPDRMAANLDVLGFDLDDEEMAELDGLEAGNRIYPDPNTFAAPQT